MLKNLLDACSVLILVATCLCGCGPITTPDPTPRTPEEICGDYGYEWVCITFSNGQEKCQCNPDGLDETTTASDPGGEA